MSSKTLISTFILAAVIALAVIVGLKFFKQVKTIKPNQSSLSQPLAGGQVLPAGKRYRSIST